jgi:hypothetical protein
MTEAGAMPHCCSGSPRGNFLCFTTTERAVAEAMPPGAVVYCREIVFVYLKGAETGAIPRRYNYSPFDNRLLCCRPDEHWSSILLVEIVLVAVGARSSNRSDAALQ